MIKKDQVHTHSNPNTNSNPTHSTPTAETVLQQEHEGRRLLSQPRQGKRKALRKQIHKKAYREKRTLIRKLTNKHKAADNIINLSKHQLSIAETSILSKGLSFIPKPKNIDNKDIILGLNKLKAQLITKTNPPSHKEFTNLLTTVPTTHGRH